MARYEVVVIEHSKVLYEVDADSEADAKQKVMTSECGDGHTIDTWTYDVESAKEVE